MSTVTSSSSQIGTELTFTASARPARRQCTEDASEPATEQAAAPKPNLTLVTKPEPTDPVAELETLLTDALASLQGTRDYLMAVKNQIKVVKADHKQKARDTKSTQLLRDKLKNAAGF